MNKSFSDYLNSLRFLSAAFVVLFHIKKVNFAPIQISKLIPDYGHEFVMIFFVLSGYLIAYSAERKATAGYKEYFLDRSSRIYSVAIPVLLLSFGLSVFHESLDPIGIYHGAYEHPFFTFAANFLFFSQAWNESIHPFWNGPYWSLSYEVVYYVLFGCFTFIRSPFRWLVIALLALAIGPKVLLLAPCWLAGVFACRYRDSWKPSPAVAAFFAFAVPILVLLILHALRFGPVVRELSSSLFGSYYDSLSWSKDFLIDYVTASLVALNLFSVRHLNFTFPARVAAFFKGGADMSYSLYLAHGPVLFGLIYILGEHRGTSGIFLLVLAIIFSFCWVFAQLTEAKRIWLRNLLGRLLGIPTKQKA